MTDNNETTLDATRSNDAGVQDSFDTVKKFIGIFGVVGAIILVTLAVLAITQDSVSTFMWVRAAILLVITPVFYRLAVRASQGSRRDFERLRTVSLIVPIAIIAVDLIPGVCPAWYAVMQAVSALALVAVAVLTRRRILRAAFSQDA